VKNSELNPSSSAAETDGRFAAEIEAGYAALTRRAGVRFCPERIVVQMTGDDRVSFMQGMCSNDIKRLSPGESVAALFLTERAHLIADAIIYATPEALLIETERDLWPAAREHLERFLVADDVEMEELEDRGVVRVDGPMSTELVGQAFGAPATRLASWRHVEIADGARVASVTRWGAHAFTIITGRAGVSNVVARLLAEGKQREVREVDIAACEIVRVESGTARIGVDTDARTLALEARMEPAISFAKGCYVGQETVERATARGALKRRLMGLRLNGGGDGRTPDGNAVILEGKEVGRLTSPVHSPTLGAIGLAILHHSAWTPGTAVSLRGANDEFSATVSELPFASD
jgi:folate-binding protein YgfZ